MTDERDAEIRGFVERAGWADATKVPIAGDASARRYVRLVGADRTAILMDGPAELDEVPAFLDVIARLEAVGASVPAILAAEPELRLVLLEDLGPELLADRLAVEPELEQIAYAQAGSLLAILSRGVSAEGLPPYDDAFFLFEIGIFLEWSTPAAPRADLLDAWAEVLPLARTGSDGFVHRDFHAQNLFWLDDRDDAARIGIIDVQGARLGPPAYDLVSLVEDARRDVAPAARRAAVAAFLRNRSDLDPTAVLAAMAVLGAQRHTKVLGLFDRLARRDGKLHYRAMRPRVLAHLQRSLAHPALAPVRAWHDRHGFGD